tara:strand:- start:1529 stop:1798 length:270 start_codon:yes stop_codon:yes gene_type:complete
MKYIFKKDYFLTADDDSVTVAGSKILVSFNSVLSQKVLSFLRDKPYVSFEGEVKEEVVTKPKFKIKKKTISNEQKKTAKGGINKNKKES